MSKSFELAITEVVDGDVEKKLPFKMAGDDTQLYAYEPDEGQIVLLIGLAGVTDPVMISATVMSVFWSLVDEPTATNLRRRMADRHDRFGLRDLMNIIEWLVEETTGFPTQPPPASTRSRPSTGQRSTAGAPPKASTRSPSRRAASAT